MEAPFGMTARITAQPGQGDALAAVLGEAAEGLRAFDGCLLYVVGRAADDPDLVLVTEAWVSREAHAASLKDERTQEQIARGRPLIADFAATELRAVTGKGLP